MYTKKSTHVAVMAALLAPLAVFAQSTNAPPPAAAVEASTPAPTAPATPAPAPALTPADLTNVSKVVEYTLLNNPEVQARYQDFRASMEGQKVSFGAMLPQINANGFIGREFRDHLGMQTPYNYQRNGYYLELRQLLWDGFGAYNVYRQAGFEKLSKFFDLMDTSDTASYAAVQAYLDTRRYRELEKLAHENYDLHEETLKLIRERATSGVGRGADLEQAGSRLALAQTNLQTESANLLDVQARYTRIVTVPPGDTLDPVPDPSTAVPENPETFADSLRANAGILSKQASIQAAEYGVSAAKSTFSPVIEFVGATGTDRADEHLVTSGPPNGDYRQVQSSSLSFQGRWNLFRGGSDLARVRQTTAQTYSTRDLRDYACRNVQQDLSTAWNNIANLRAQIPFLREHAISTAKVRDAYRQQFRIGQRTLLDLLNTENERFEAARALANAQYDLTLAQYRWLSLSHKILPLLQLAQLESSDELPKEAADLKLTDEVIKQCATPVIDTSRLKPIMTYSEGDKPPTLSSPAAQPAPAGKW